MSSGQSDRNGNSVEPGLPNTRLMPKARRRSNVACLTVTVLVGGLRDDIIDPGKTTAIRIRHSGAMRSIEPGISRFRVRANARPGMTAERSPRRRSFHRGLALGVGGP